MEKATAWRLGKDPRTLEDASITEDRENSSNGGEGSDIEMRPMSSKPHVKGYNLKDQRLQDGNWMQ